MKTTFLLALAISTVAYSQINLAGDISDTYATGDTLTATKMNNVKSAVNDNNTRLGVLNSLISTMQPYHVAYVSYGIPGGANYNDPVVAMADLATWCGTPSATNPCLLKIMPGVYDLGTRSLQMQSYVDIEGSGENITLVKSNIDNGNTGVVVGAGAAELRDLTVENTGVSGSATAIYIQDPGSIEFFLLRRVTARVTGDNLLISRGVQIINNNFKASDLTVKIIGNNAASSVGISISGGVTAELQNVDVTQNGSSSNPRRGIVANGAGGYISVRHSRVSSTVAAVSSNGALLEINYTTLQGISVLEGTSPTINFDHNTVYGSISGTGTKRCVASFNGSTGGILGYTTCL